MISVNFEAKCFIIGVKSGLDTFRITIVRHIRYARSFRVGVSVPQWLGHRTYSSIPGTGVSNFFFPFFS